MNLDLFAVVDNSVRVGDMPQRLGNQNTAFSVESVQREGAGNRVDATKKQN